MENTALPSLYSCSPLLEYVNINSFLDSTNLRDLIVVFPSSPRVKVNLLLRFENDVCCKSETKAVEDKASSKVRKSIGLSTCIPIFVFTKSYLLTVLSAPHARSLFFLQRITNKAPIRHIAAMASNNIDGVIILSPPMFLLSQANAQAKLRALRIFPR